MQKPITTLDWCREDEAWKRFHIKRGDQRNWLFYDRETRLKFASAQIASLGMDWCKGEFEQYVESVAWTRKEAFAFLTSLGYEHDGKDHCYNAISPNEKRIALFAHAGFGMAFLSTVLDVPYPAFCTRFDLSHSALSVIRFQGEGKVIPCLLQLSNDSHIYREGLPTKYNNEIFF